MNVERDLRTSSSTFTPTTRDVPVPSRSPGPLPPVPMRARLGVFVARVRASVWATIIGRALAVLGALLVLAWIGRTADAARAAGHAGDAGADPATAPTVVTTEPAVGAAAAPLAVAAVANPPVTEPPRAAGDADASMGAAEAVEGPRPSAGRATPNAPVYLNDADEAELRRLPGVGAKRAHAILAQRARLGRFKRVEDLLRVKGVGRKAIQKWRPLVRLEPRERESHDEAPSADGGPGSGAR